MRRALLLSLVLSWSPGCKGSRGKLEELVPDGATGIVSVDVEALVKSEFYASARSKIEAIPGAKPKLDTLRDTCALDLDKAQSYVVGFDVIGQNFVVAARMPKLGTKQAIECALGELLDADERKDVVVGEDGGRLTLDIDGGKGKGWGLDDDTLVIASKGWGEAVASRIQGGGKAAIDANLKEAVGLADRKRHVWFAGELPPLLAPKLEELPIKGLQRVAGGIDVTADFDMVLVGGFADDAAATAASGALAGAFDAGKAFAVAQGIPQPALDSVRFSAEGKLVRIEAKVPMLALFEQATTSFQRYLSRAKTSEARVHIAKMFDGAAAYFNEEHVDRGEVATIGAGGTIATAAPHRCPNDGRETGSAGITPPLSVDCSKGCTPGVDYDMKLWTDNVVWNALNFQQEQRHYFHYDFRWQNTHSAYGMCQFTAQAFGDLDADKTFSTYERAGAADQAGINAGAGLYIDQEVE